MLMENPLTQDHPQLDQLAKRLVDRARALGGTLAPLVGAREKDVLSLGEGLSQAVTRLDELQAGMQELVDMMTGQGVRDCADGFRRQMGELAPGDETGSDASLLSDFDAVIGHARELGQALQGFTRIVQTLRVLGISTRIESARLGQQGQEFTALSDAVERLVDRVDADATSVRTKAAELGRVGEQAKRDTQKAMAETRRDKDEAASLLENNFETLTYTMEDSGQLADSLATTMNEIGSDISDVVTSLQFHDIVRQQVEHVAETLLELDQQSADNGTALEELSWIHEVGGLLVAQMQHAKDSLVSAGDQSRERIESIGRRLSEMRGNVGDLLTKGQAKAALEAVVGGVDRVLSALAATKANSERIMEASRQVFEHIRQITSLVEDIEGVGEEIELIALNASIKSARAGEVGAALGVLAQAIQELSKNARSQSSGIGGILGRASDVAERLGARSGSGEQDLRLEETVHSLKQGVGPLTEASSRLTGDIGRLTEQAAGLGQELARLGQGIRYPQELARQLVKAKDDIERMGSEAFAALPQGYEPAPSPRLKELLARYTMEAERLVHAGGDVGAPCIVSGGAAGADFSGGGELGDNIDLF